MRHRELYKCDPDHGHRAEKERDETIPAGIDRQGNEHLARDDPRVSFPLDPLLKRLSTPWFCSWVRGAGAIATGQYQEWPAS